MICERCGASHDLTFGVPILHREEVFFCEPCIRWILADWLESLNSSIPYEVRPDEKNASSQTKSHGSG